MSCFSKVATVFCAGLLVAMMTASAVMAADLNKVVIIKADDFRGPSEAWTNFLQVSRSAGIKVSIGVIVDSIAGKSSISSWMRAQAAHGDVEFWNHGWDHRQWTTNGQTVSEFQGADLEHQRDHLARAQAGLKTALGKNVISFGTPFNGFDSNTAAVINETPAFRLFFCHNVALAKNLVTSRVAILDIISESDGTGKPNFEKFKTAFEKRAPGPVSLQFHPPYFSPTALAEYGKIVNYLRTNDYSIQLPAEYVNAQTGQRLNETGHP
ncbi:MAG: polysaccharide deacetylase family protein [Limisphaerales bacterium]